MQNTATMDGFSPLNKVATPLCISVMTLAPSLAVRSWFFYIQVIPCNDLICASKYCFCGLQLQLQNPKYFDLTTPCESTYLRKTLTIEQCEISVASSASLLYTLNGVLARSSKISSFIACARALYMSLTQVLCVFEMEPSKSWRIQANHYLVCTIEDLHYVKGLMFWRWYAFFTHCQQCSHLCYHTNFFSCEGIHWSWSKIFPQHLNCCYNFHMTTRLLVLREIVFLGNCCSLTLCKYIIFVSVNTWLARKHMLVFVID